ncbi:MAG TPA: transcriptional repressor [Candidatus Onthomonas avicola]|nr:transcriptional repressor [Candidatus Onthomonas avicola]
MTKYERAIYQLVTQSTRHMTADQVFSELKRTYPTISLATIYNNLNKLCAAGLVRRIPIEGSPDRYDRVARHDHVVCRRCGALTDVCFEDMTDSLRRQLGEDFLFYDLKVYYLCPDCRRRERGQA